jgi:uncharacterized protein YehS (DUF1456 family)
MLDIFGHKEEGYTVHYIGKHNGYLIYKFESDDFENYKNIGFYLDGYAEFYVIGGAKSDLLNAIRKANEFFKVSNPEIEIIEDLHCSDLFRFVNLEYFERFSGRNRESPFIKIKGCNKSNYINIFNVVLLFLNQNVINTEKSNSLNLVHLHNLMLRVNSMSTSKNIWGRNNKLKSLDIIPFIYFINGLRDYGNEMDSILNLYRSLESYFDKGKKSKEAFNEFLNKLNYVDNDISVDEIIKIRNGFVHPKRKKNFLLYVQENQTVLSNTKLKLVKIIMFMLENGDGIESLEDVYIPLNESEFDGLFYFDEEQKYGEIGMHLNIFINGLISIPDKLSRNDNSEFLIEISEASEIFKRKYDVTDGQTMKISQTQEKHFINDVFQTMIELYLTVLENENTTDEISFPSLHYYNGKKFSQYGRVNYSNLKNINTLEQKYISKLHLFNDALTAKNNYQFVEYYLFIQSFFKTNRHGKECQVLFKKFYLKTSKEVREVYEKHFAEDDKGNLAYIFSTFRKDCFHANYVKAKNSVLLQDDEHFVQTMMAREFCIVLMNEQVIK